MKIFFLFFVIYPSLSFLHSGISLMNAYNYLIEEFISDEACDECEDTADDRHNSNSVDESAEDVDLSRNGSTANG